MPSAEVVIGTLRVNNYLKKNNEKQRQNIYERRDSSAAVMISALSINNYSVCSFKDCIMYDICFVASYVVHHMMKRK